MPLAAARDAALVAIQVHGISILSETQCTRCNKRARRSESGAQPRCKRRDFGSLLSSFHTVNTSENP